MIFLKVPWHQHEVGFNVRPIHKDNNCTISNLYHQDGKPLRKFHMDNDFHIANTDTKEIEKEIIEKIKKKVDEKILNLFFNQKQY